jgi:hypothetical protein
MANVDFLFERTIGHVYSMEHHRMCVRIETKSRLDNYRDEHTQIPMQQNSSRHIHLFSSREKITMDQ